MRRLTIILLSTAFPLAVTAQDRPVLVVLTYESFVTEWGPGPVIEPVFEAECGCDLHFVTAGDGAALVPRLRLEGGRTDVDVVLGIDNSLLAEAADSQLFAPHGLDLSAVEFDLPVTWDDAVYLPFDWGFFAFVHDTARVPEPPTSLAALAESELAIVIEDPRSSTPGLGLLLWVKAVFGADAPAFWQRLAPRIVTVTPGWSEAYGMFLAGEADMVLSYTTSPAYHIVAEGDEGKAAALFEEGHYVQVELAARLASTDQAALADRFLAFMLSPAFQEAIPTTNWMYPAVTPAGGLPAGFAGLARPEKALMFDPGQVREIRREALDEWQDALSR